MPGRDMVTSKSETEDIDPNLPQTVVWGIDAGFYFVSKPLILVPSCVAQLVGVRLLQLYIYCPILIFRLLID